MQAIENLTRLRGQMLKRMPHPSRAGYDLVTVQISDTQAVDGKANLLGCHQGQALEIAVRSDLLQGADASRALMVDLRAKMTPDGALAEPHPEPGNFTVVAGPDPG